MRKVPDFAGMVESEIQTLKTYHHIQIERGQWTGKEKTRWSESQKQQFKSKILRSIIRRIIEMEKDVGVHQRHQAERTRKREGPLKENRTVCLRILGFTTWNQCYNWFNSMLGPDMDIDMFLDPVLIGGERVRQFIELGHIVPIEHAKLLLLSDRHWFWKYFHYSNLGPQFKFMNKYMGASCLYPMQWTESSTNGNSKWNLINDCQFMRDVRERYENRSSMMLRAMSVIRKEVLGQDNVPDKFLDAARYKFFQVKYDRYYVGEEIDAAGIPYFRDGQLRVELTPSR